MIVQLFVIVRLDISTWEHRLDMREEFRVDRHHVFKTTVDWTILDHPNLAVTFNNLRFNLANLLVDKYRNVLLATQDLLTRLDDTIRTQRVSRSRPSQGGLCFLPG